MVLNKHNVTRICINPQTFSDDTLKKIGRDHTTLDTIEAYELAREFPFVINMDLIAGLENETFKDFKNSLNQAISLKPDNITVHTLSVKKASRLIETKYELQSAKLVEKDKLYEAKEALEIIEKMPKAKFDETVELHVKLGVDSKHADQQVRGTVVLPHGTGKSLRVLVFAKGDKAKEAEAAGADFVGAEELVPKIEKENWFDYDVIVATPDMMGVIGRLGKVLGPKGLMPNPKSGTVTMDVAKAINEIKSGKVEYRLDKTNIIHLGFGKVSFGADKLLENYETIMDAIIKAKPAAAKGQYVKSIAISTSMGPSLYIG